MDDDGDDGLYRNTDPDTSASAVPPRANREAIMFQLLRAHGDELLKANPYDGLTDAEASFMAGFDPRDGHWRRCSDLRKRGWIRFAQPGEVTQIRRVNPATGKFQRVSVLTDSGADAYGRGLVLAD